VLLTLAVAPRLHPPWLLLPDCVHFSCCSLTASDVIAAEEDAIWDQQLTIWEQQWILLLFSDCVHFSLYSLVASTCDHAHAVQRTKVMCH